MLVLFLNKICPQSRTPFVLYKNLYLRFVHTIVKSSTIAAYQECNKVMCL